jgi:hypothetical protein
VPRGARQSSLPGKNAPSTLCRALDENAHGKGCAVRILVFAVRRAIPVMVHCILMMVSFNYKVK